MIRSKNRKIRIDSMMIVGAIVTIMFLFGYEMHHDYDFKVKGLHYLNNEPVEIGIKDGKISNIKRIKRLSDEANSLIIAPGLIDNQVNGYKEDNRSRGDCVRSGSFANRET